MTKKPLTLKELTDRVHAEVGKSMGIDFNIESQHHLYTTAKAKGFTIDEIMENLRSMVDAGTIPPTDPSFLPAFNKRLEEMRVQDERSD